MFRLTDGDIMKKCSGAAVEKTTNDGGDQDMELDTCARPPPARAPSTFVVF
jgi:hypothetical protein